jgi:hypothetical protein
MSYLPPVGWADVTTKHDLDTQTALLRAEMAKLGSDLRAELHASLANQLRWILTAMVAMTGIFSFIVTIAR